MSRVEPVTLQAPGGVARLEPLRPHHARELFESGDDDRVWTYSVERPACIADMETFIARAMAAEAAGSELPFAIIDTATSRVIGSTRYMEIIPAHRALEIGWTWIGVPWQRTGCNTLCKYLLLRHAFEQLGMNRAQFKADARNTKSRAAIERIGGIYEGTLRKHRIARDGFVRDSAYYSVISAEWPKVKCRLHKLMQWPESA